MKFRKFLRLAFWQSVIVHLMFYVVNGFSFPRLKCWVLADKITQQIAYQKEKIRIAEEKFTFDEILGGAEDKAELELLREKYLELESQFQKQKGTNEKALQAKDKEVEKKKEKIKKLKSGDASTYLLIFYSNQTLS